MELELPHAYPGSTELDAAAALEREVESNAALERAEAAWHAKDYARAARLFMLASRPILVASDAFNADIMAQNRLVCYVNAQRAFRLSGDVERGRAALLEAARADAHHAAAIRALADAIEPAKSGR